MVETSKGRPLRFEGTYTRGKLRSHAGSLLSRFTSMPCARPRCRRDSHSRVSLPPRFA